MMEFFLNLGWEPSEEDTCPDAEETFNFMLENFASDADCLSQEDFEAMWGDLDLDGRADKIFNRLDRDGDGCLSLEEWTRFMRRVCRMCGLVTRPLHKGIR